MKSGDFPERHKSYVVNSLENVGGVGYLGKHGPRGLTPFGFLKDPTQELLCIPPPHGASEEAVGYLLKSLAKNPFICNVNRFVLILVS